jgi:hypothetical protein
MHLERVQRGRPSSFFAHITDLICERLEEKGKSDDNDLSPPVSLSISRLRDVVSIYFSSFPPFML